MQWKIIIVTEYIPDVVEVGYMNFGLHLTRHPRIFCLIVEFQNLFKRCETFLWLAIIGLTTTLLFMDWKLRNSDAWNGGKNTKFAMLRFEQFH